MKRKEFSRRDFMKGAAAGAVGLAAASVLGACSQDNGQTTAGEAASSAAGLQAAGVKTYLLEKGGSCGIANGCMAGGPALAETRVQKEENATVSQQTLYECEYGFSRGTVGGALLRRCIAQGEAVVSNFMDNGVNMGLRVDAYGMGFRARHNFVLTIAFPVPGPAAYL